MRKIVIFGANSAVAEACALIWAQQGHELFLVGRDTQKLRAIESNLKLRSHRRIISRAADLADTDAHSNLFMEAKNALDGIDTILIAHGILGNQIAAENDYALIKEILQVNLLSTISLLTYGGIELQAQGRGNIAVITSVAGDRGRGSNYVYGTSKGAVSIFLSGLRNRLFHKGIAVTDIKLGFVDSPMTRAYKKGILWKKPEDVAAEIVRAIDRGRSIAYVPWFWRFIMLVIRNIPENLFKRLKL